MGMMRRRTRRRTAMVVGGAAYARGRNRGQQDAYADEGAYEPEPQAPEPQYVPPAPPPPAPTDGPADLAQLKELAELHDSGVLTDEEFAAQKAKVLG